jgi:phosphoenolpyruvate carboxylase
VVALLDERERVEEQLAALYGGPLASRRPLVAAAVARRAPALARLHAAQVDVLGRWRAARAAGDVAAAKLEAEVLLTVNAIAAGLGATG